MQSGSDVNVLKEFADASASVTSCKNGGGGGGGGSEKLTVQEFRVQGLGLLGFRLQTRVQGLGDFQVFALGLGFVGFSGSV